MEQLPCHPGIDYKITVLGVELCSAVTFQGTTCRGAALLPDHPRPGHAPLDAHLAEVLGIQGR